MDDLYVALQRTNDIVESLADVLQSTRTGNTQTVIHKTEGMGAWGAAAVTACFCTWFGLVLLMFDLHDLRAWVDTYRAQIAQLQTQVKALLEKTK